MKYLSIIFLILTIQSFAQKNNEVNTLKERTNMDFELTLENWQNIPCTKNRNATKEDVDNGNAVFVIENIEHKPYKIELPKLAYWNDIESDDKKLVVIIQMEESSQGIVTGYKDFEGNYGAGFFYEFNILSEKEIQKLKK
jgi:hypothetical protein